jgi:tyramine---L-glutamate ligase
LRIAVLEWITGSGHWHAPRESSEDSSTSELLLEGSAMLYALARDLQKSGHEVFSAMEPSVLSWASQHLVSQPPFVPFLIPFRTVHSLDCVLDAWSDIARQCDATMVIAPELEHWLPRLITGLRERNISVIAPSASFLEVATDKWQTGQHLRDASMHHPNVKHPHTMRLDQWLSSSMEHPSEHGWVLKKRCGAGGVGMRRFSSSSKLRAHALTMLQESAHQRPTGNPNSEGELEEWIVQPWIAGQPASMAILAGSQVHVLGTMRQHLSESIAPDPSISYLGGSGPAASVSAEFLDSFGKGVLQAIPGQPRGWTGVDFVIDPQGAWHAIEINARLTSSYLGYRKWLGHRLADAIVTGDLSRCPIGLQTECSFSVADFRG